MRSPTAEAVNVYLTEFRMCGSSSFPSPVHFSASTLPCCTYHDAVQVLVSFLHCIRVFFHSFLQFFRGSATWKSFVNWLMEISLMPLSSMTCFTRGLVRGGLSLPAGRVLLFVADMKDGSHFFVIQCRMVEEQIPFTGFQFIEGTDEALFFFSRCPARAIISDIGEPVIFG